MNAPLPVQASTPPALAMSESDLMSVLQNSLYPGAKPESIKLVVGYCKAASLDPMQKPVHIVPMDVPTGRKDEDGWDIKEKRDVVMPGVGLYRIQAARTGEHVGTSEPEFGPTATTKLGDTTVTYPEWCRVKVYRQVGNRVAEFSAVERWIENYASKSKSKKDPNAMWAKRPWAQLAKCAEAQALRRGFPEIGQQPTADEMEGKSFEDLHEPEAQQPKVEMPRSTQAPKPEERVKPEVVVDHETGEVTEQPAQQPAAAARPMQQGQVRIIKAQMARAALTDLDFATKWGRPLVDDAGEPAFDFESFGPITQWIASKAAG